MAVAGSRIVVAGLKSAQYLRRYAIVVITFKRYHISLINIHVSREKFQIEQAAPQYARSAEDTVSLRASALTLHN